MTWRSLHDVLRELERDDTDYLAGMDKRGTLRGVNVSEPTLPSGEAVADVAIAIERLLPPDEELIGLLFLAQARTLDGEIKNRIYFQPPERQDRLLNTMRDYLAGPPPGMKEYGTE